MSRLDDVQAAHEATKRHPMYGHGEFPSPMGKEHAAIPGLIRIARAAREYVDAPSRSPGGSGDALVSALADFEAGRDG